MKTVSVALVLCLNVGVDPPDVVKPQPCARVECWIGELRILFITQSDHHLVVPFVFTPRPFPCYLTQTRLDEIIFKCPIQCRIFSFEFV